MGTGTYDFDNAFGQGGGFNDLDGLNFTIVAIYDPTLGNVVALGPSSEGRRGGLVFGAVPNPVQDVKITIDGVTVGFTPDARSQIQSNLNNSFQLTFQQYLPGAPALKASFSLTATYAAPGQLGATLPTTNVGGAALLDLYNANAQRGHMSFVLRDAQITTYTQGGVPEPVTWALMVGGFGLSGAMLRRRRSAVAA